VQAPDQPAKVWLAPGVAVRVTLVPEVYAALQIPDVQLMPAGELVTVPVPITEVDNKNDSVFAIDITYIVSRVTFALVAITATLCMPTGVLVLVIIFKVELQRGLQLVGEKVATAPVGKPEAEKDTSRVVPEIKEVVIVVKIDPPGTIDSAEGLADNPKLNGAVKRVVKIPDGFCALCLIDSILVEKAYL